jgi:hypothetical protein
MISRCVESRQSLWGDHLDSGVGQFPIQTIGIVGVITDQTLYRFGDEEVRQCLLDEGYLVRCCRPTKTATGTPVPSTAAMIFVTWPRLVLPTPAPLSFAGQSFHQ